MPLYALIPGLPLVAFAILALAWRRWAETSHRVGIVAIGGSFALSVAALFEVARSGPISISLYRLLRVGDLSVDVGLHIDQLAVLVLILVTGVSFVVQVYSSRYMTGDPRYRRFFAVMALFTFAMTLLVTSANLLVTYMAWEVMGICSYLLISHWAERLSAARAATKAFLVNSAADVGLGFGVILTVATYGTLNIQEILGRVSSMSGETLDFFGFEIATNTVIALCLLSGAMGKSAQVPMHVWLPFAMEAPTPVSALIHAATMVNAGPFLLVRFSPLLLVAPAAMAVIAAVGAITALYGALVSLTQSDIKKLLAYSTISQIGFMIFACGVGAFGAAIFHLLAHGFLKGFLFLSTGNSLVATGGHVHGRVAVPSGRLRTLAAGALALACVPPFLLFAGPYEGIWTAQELASARVAFWAVGLATVFFTGIYAFRGIVSLFGRTVGREVSVYPRVGSAHVPGIVLSGAIVAAFLLGLWAWFGDFLGPVVGSPQAGSWEFGYGPWLAIPLLAAIAGWSWAYFRQVRPAAVPLADRPWTKRAYVHLLNKLYFDELHETCVVAPVLRLSNWLWRAVDMRLIDRAVHGAGRWARRFADWVRDAIEEQLVLGMLRGLTRAAVGISHWLWRFDGALMRIGHLGDGAGEALQRVEPRTMRHHSAIVVCGLVVAIALSYWLAR